MAWRMYDNTAVGPRVWTGLAGFALGYDETGHRVKVTAVTKAGSRRFFEYVPLERETGVSRAGTTYSAVEVQYRLAG